MKIDIGNSYFLCGDSECMWISKRKQAKEGTEYDERYSGYYRTYEDLFANFVECHFRKSDVKDTAELLKQINIAETEVRYMAKRLGRELDGEVK